MFFSATRQRYAEYSIPTTRVNGIAMQYKLYSEEFLAALATTGSRPVPVTAPAASAPASAAPAAS